MKAEKQLKCQNCHLLLQIDSSLLDLSLSQRNLLMNNSTLHELPKSQNTNYYTSQEKLDQVNTIQPISKINEWMKGTGNSIIDTTQGDYGVTSTKTDKEDESGNGDSQNNGYTTEKTLSNQITTLTNVFNILSARSYIDYPVCQDCCNILINKLKIDYNNALKQKELYKDFLDKLESQTPTGTTYDNDTNTQVLQKEKDQLLRDLIELENENGVLDQEILQLQQSLEKQKQIYNDFIQDENVNDLTNIEFQKEMQLLENQYNHAMNNLDQIRRTNIYNETFKISHRGAFGTINDLRLGGYSDCPVSWNEINAAVGQIILLLATITTRLKLKINGYKLKPMGSLSKISRYDNGTKEWIEFEAFNNGNSKFTKLFRKETDFDKAMACIPDIIQQVTSMVTSTERRILDSASNAETFRNNGKELPYDMAQGNINGISIKLYGSEPTIQWTTAMKCLLTNMKWLLAYSSAHLQSNSSQPVD